MRDKYLSELTQHNADLTALEAAEQRAATVEQQLRGAQVGWEVGWGGGVESGGYGCVLVNILFKHELYIVAVNT